MCIVSMHPRSLCPQMLVSIRNSRPSTLRLVVIQYNSYLNLFILHVGKHLNYLLPFDRLCDPYTRNKHSVNTFTYLTVFLTKVYKYWNLILKIFNYTFLQLRELAIPICIYKNTIQMYFHQIYLPTYPQLVTYITFIIVLRVKRALHYHSSVTQSIHIVFDD